MKMNAVFGAALISILCGISIADDEKAAKHTNNFAFDVYKKLVKPGDNLVFSPFSLASVLALLMEGAPENSQTAKEIKAGLHYDQLTHKEIDAYYKNSMEQMKPTTEMDLTLANAIWIKQGFKVKQNFVDHLNETYSATQNEFTPDESGMVKINNWVKTNTKGKIEKLLDEEPSDALMMLMNAIYFKGKWVTKFDATKTEEKDFNQINSVKKIKMMNVESLFFYKDSDDLKAEVLSLRYEGNSTRLIVILPHKDTTLEDVESKLNAQSFENELNMFKTKVEVFLPKFNLETTLPDLISALKKLKITDAFGPGADFSQITDTGALQVTQIIQKAIIEVNEEGTTAAAVTSAKLSRNLPSAPPPPPPIFNANRPFFYALYNDLTNTILFMGRFVKV